MLNKFHCQECGCTFVAVKRDYIHRFETPACPVCGCDDMLKPVPHSSCQAEDQKFIVETLTILGGKRWTKSNLDRLYLPDAVLYDLLKPTLSDPDDVKVIDSLHECKFYCDLKTASYGYKHFQGCKDLHSEVFNALDWYLNEKYTSKKTATAVPEATLDEINAALGL